LISQKYQTAVAGSLVVGGLLLITFLSPESGENNRKNRAFSTLGLLGFYIVLYATSANRKKIVWKTVIVGLLSQYVLALFVLRTKVGYDIFAFISFLAR
jgi:concentrative nucleoside transporter, CNT family